MTFYADSAYPVRADLAEIHASQLERLGAPGTWGIGAQRLAVAAAARSAGYEAGFLEKPEDEGAPVELELPEVASRVAQRVAVAPQEVDQAFYQAALADGRQVPESNRISPALVA